MPKSKRDKKVSLTQTKKKGMLFKKQLMDEVRRCVEHYTNIFVFTIRNIRNAQLKDLRSEWKHSRFFFGKNRVMALGLGLTSETECQDNLHKLAKRLTGQCGLLFTNKERDEVIQFFDNYRSYSYARAGFIASETIILPAGPLEQFPHSMEPQLRELGLPTSLQKGVITLVKDACICEKGKPLRPEQSRLLKLLQKEMAEFQLIMKCVWSKGGTFEKIFRDKSNSEDVIMKEVEESGESEVDKDNDLSTDETRI